MNTPTIQDIRLAPLTCPQSEIWYDQMLHRDSPLYNIGGYMRIQGSIDPRIFEEAVRQLVRKHDVMRTVLVAGQDADNMPMQGFAPDMPVTVPFIDLSEEHASQQAALDWMRKQFSKPFSLHDEPLFRYALLKLGPASFNIFVCYHHLIADGWSIALLARSLAVIYTALKAGEEIDLCAPSYLDFVENDRAYVASQAFDTQRQYWLNKFQPAPESLIPVRRVLGENAQASPATCSVLSLPRDWYDRIGGLAHEYGGTTFHAIVAALYVYFTRTAQRNELVVGLPVLNRANAAFKATAGLFVGVTAARFGFGTGLSFGELLRSIGRELKQNYRHQRFPISGLLREAGRLGRDRPQLFDIGLSYERHDYEAAFGQASGIAIPLVNEHMPNPLMLYVREFHDDEPVQLDFVYHKACFSDEEIGALQERLLHILDGALQAPDTPVRDISLLVPHEVRQIALWNSTGRDRQTDPGLLDMFNTQVRQHGDRAAVVVDGCKIRYRELDERANQLARYLQTRHRIVPDMLVGLFMERSVEMIVGVLGVLKAGAAYLPLDPSYPSERLQRTLDDARPAALLSQIQLIGRLPPSQSPLILIDSEWDDIATFAPDAIDDPAVAANLAYVIYTSGSTGNPKGVAVSRGNLRHSMLARVVCYSEPVERFLLTWSFAFDGSITGIFWTLFSGGTLFLASEDEYNDAAAVLRLIEYHAITHLLSIPSFHALLLDAAESWQLASLSIVIVAGEACGADLVKQHFAMLPQASLFNEYGPTEGSVWSTVHRCEPGQDSGSVPIGTPIENVQVHLLDQYLEPVPVGVPAELYISGDGVACGYLRNPDLTAEKFIPDPFSKVSGARLYKTGDLARWRSDGSIEFLGRTDHQVKVRGFRIELTDIEAALLAQPAVLDAAVLVREETPGDQRLVAYVVLSEHAIDKLAQRQHRMEDASGQLTRKPLQDNSLSSVVGTKATRMLKEALERALPRHMMPHHFVLLEDMPRTPNGKTDRKALPPPQLDRADVDYVAPCTPVESILAGIWSRLLKMERVSRHDNFFDLGGHSLLAIRLIQHMREQGLHAEVRTVFTARTLAELAAATREQDGTAAVAPNLIPPQCPAIHPWMLPLVTLTQDEIDRIVAFVPGGVTNVQDIYPLGPQQEGLLLHRLAVAEGDAFLLRALFAANTRECFDPLLKALQVVIDRHEVLRTAVLWEGLAEPVQVVLRQAVPVVEWVELDDDGGDIAEQLMARFDTHHFRLDVRQAPLLRIAIARDGANDRWLMLLLTHHLVFDHTSLDVFTEELRSHMTGQAEKLSVTPQYRDYVAQTLRTTSRQEHEDFFRRMLGDVDQPTVPFGLQDVMSNGAGISENHRAVEPRLTARLRKQARELGVGVASLCHLAWALVLARTSGRDDVVFGTVLFGRMHGNGVERAMGLFINTLPVRVRLGRHGVGERAREVHALLAELLQHEHAPLSLVQRCSAVPAPAPLFSALLNYRYSDKDAASPGAHAWPGITLLSGEERTNYPFFLSIDDFGEDLELTAQTSDAVGASRICGFMHTTLENLVQALESAPCTPCHAIDVLPMEEHALLHRFNDTATSQPHARMVQQMFEEQAVRTPRETAVIHQDQTLTYTELNAAANRLAHRLIDLGVGPDQLVGVCLERSAEMIIALLAILKAGGTYLPLDPAYPRERLSWMLEDAAPAVVLTRRVLLGKLPATVQKIFCLDDADRTLLACPVHNPGPALLPDHLAYVLYTSGSTGKPKGVMVRHGGLANLAWLQAERLRTLGCRVMLQFASINFDMSVEEIFPALICGACLVIRPSLMLVPDSAFLQMIQLHQIDALNLPTVFWHDWVQRLDTGESEIPDSVKMVAVGGEKICIEHYRRWIPHTAGRNGSWVNAYGPTEATVNATLFELPFADSSERLTMPIGRPLDNTCIHILDAHLNPVPVGVPGELHIGGSGLARGYLGRPDLTAEKFIPDPFNKTHGARLYKSGDLASFLPDGTIAYLGRIDNQVKIRGFRIELGEIESALATHPDIREVVVTVRDDGGIKRLIAYVTHNNHTDVAALRAHLAARLPDYMLPSAYVMLDALPLLPNGKINRHALPEPGESACLTGAGEEPQGKVEETLARIWRELLKLDRVSRHDNFFELGGHSLLAVRMTARIREAFGLVLPLSQLFQSPSVVQLAAAIDARQATSGLVVPMKQGKPGNPPIWLIHPGGGTVFCYRQLAERFPSEHPVYAIQSPEIAGMDASKFDFDGLCRRYTAEILRVQTEGPICLAGWSLGGAIAFRTAELLEHAGHSVSWIGLFDTVLKEKIQPLDFEEFVIWAFTRTHADAWSADPALDAGRKRVETYVAQYGTEHVRQRLLAEPQWLESALLPDKDCLGFVRQQYEIMRLHSTWMAGFVPGLVDAPLHVFRAQASVESEKKMTDWLCHTRHARESTLRTLPGTHENVILLASNINEIVRTLTQAVLVEAISV